MKKRILGLFLLMLVVMTIIIHAATPSQYEEDVAQYQQEEYVAAEYVYDYEYDYCIGSAPVMYSGDTVYE